MIFLTTPIPSNRSIICLRNIILLFIIGLVPVEVNAFRLCFIGDSGVTPEKDNKNYIQNLNDRDRVVQKLEQSSCDRVYVLGDIFYPEGIGSGHDPEFQKQLTEPYQSIMDQGIPFYLVLGNHDYMLNPAYIIQQSSPDPLAKFPQVDEIMGKDGSLPSYMMKMESLRDTSTKQHPHVKLPGPFWEEFNQEEGREGYGICIATIDSNPFWPIEVFFQRMFTAKRKIRHPFSFSYFVLMRTHQRRWIESFIQRSKFCKLKIALAHHPYMSVGGHGNAGDGLLKFGHRWKSFVEKYILGEFDFLITGHDHNLSYEGAYSCTRNCNEYKRSKKTHLLVSGGASTLKDLNKNNLKIMQKKSLSGQNLFGKKSLGFITVDYEEEGNETDFGSTKFLIHFFDPNSEKWNEWTNSQDSVVD